MGSDEYVMARPRQRLASIPGLDFDSAIQRPLDACEPQPTSMDDGLARRPENTRSHEMNRLPLACTRKKIQEPAVAKFSPGFGHLVVTYCCQLRRRIAVASC